MTPGLECSMTQKAAQFNRGDYGRRQQQRIVDEGGGQGQRLVQPKQQSQSYRRQGLQPINGNNADEDSPKYSRRGRGRIKPLGQQDGNELANMFLQSLEHYWTFS